MKKILLLLPVFCFLCFVSLEAKPFVVEPTKTETTEEVTQTKDAKKLRQQKRVEKKLNKLKKKFAKKGGLKKDGTAQDWSMNDSKFRLGVILILGGLALGLVASLLGIAVFNWLAGLALLIGVILLVLSFLD